MKKLISLALAILMIASLALTASAATNSFDEVPVSDNNDVVINVNVKDGDTTEVDKVYKVDIAWEDLTFDFTLSVNKEDLEYDEVTHTYTNVAGSWEADLDADIVVTNHSNAAVVPTVTFVGGATTATNHNVTATITGAVSNDQTLKSAEGTAAGVSNTYTVAIDRTSVPNVLGFTLAKIVVSIAAE